MDPESKEEPFLVADNLASAFLGLMFHFNVLEPVACYDYERVIQTFMADGMTEEEAIDFFEFKVIGAYAGPRTPCFVQRMSLEEAIEREGGGD